MIQISQESPTSRKEREKWGTLGVFYDQKWANPPEVGKGYRAPGAVARLCAGTAPLLLGCSQFFPDGGVIRYIEYRLRFSMFDNVSYAVYSDYLVGWITRRESRRRMF